MRKLIFALTLLNLLCFTFGSNGQCTTGSAGTVCTSPGITWTSRGSIGFGSVWKSVTVTSTGYHQFTFSDSGYIPRTGAFFELYTCGPENYEVSVVSYNFQNLLHYKDINNFSCDSNTNNEYLSFSSSTAVYHYLRVCLDSCNPTTDTFKIYYRLTCRSNDASSTMGDSVWRGHVWNPNALAYQGSDYMGYYGEETFTDFTKNFGSTQPVVTNGNCFMCFDSSDIDNDTFVIAYQAIYKLPSKSYYRIKSADPNLLSIQYAGSTYLWNYTTVNQSKAVPVKSSTFLLSPVTGWANGYWTYRTYKDTGSLQADFHYCKMDGDKTYGNNSWNSYVYDTSISSATNADSRYQGALAATSQLFSYDWGSGQPSISGERCGQTMNDDYYHVLFLNRKSFTSGRYRFRIKCDDGVALTFRRQSNNGVTATPISNFTSGSKDITSGFYTLSGDTNISLHYTELTGNSRISFLYCKEPADPGSIISSRDTVCQGDSVTLKASTIDGTQTQWYRSVCGDSTKYLGAGDSIRVAIDSSTTFYVRNRNRCVSDDTTNVLDLFSQNCASKRIYKHSYVIPPLDVNALISNTSQIASGNITVNLTGGLPPYSYNWDGHDIPEMVDSFIILFNSFGGNYNDLQSNTLQVDTPGLYYLNVNDSLCYQAVYEFSVGDEVYFIYSANLLKTDTIVYDSIYIKNYSEFEKLDSVSWVSGFFFSNQTAHYNSVFSSVNIISDTGAIYFGFTSIDSASFMMYSNPGDPFSSLLDSTRQLFYFLNNNYYIIDSGGLSAALGTYTYNDSFIVERNGSQILFKKNDTIVRTNTMSFIGNIYAGGSVYAPGSKGKFNMINY